MPPKFSRAWPLAVGVVAVLAFTPTTSAVPLSVASSTSPYEPRGGLTAGAINYFGQLALPQAWSPPIEGIRWSSAGVATLEQAKGCDTGVLEKASIG